MKFEPRSSTRSTPRKQIDEIIELSEIQNPLNQSIIDKLEDQQDTIDKLTEDLQNKSILVQKLQDSLSHQQTQFDNQLSEASDSTNNLKLQLKQSTLHHKNEIALTKQTFANEFNNKIQTMEDQYNTDLE